MVPRCGSQFAHYPAWDPAQCRADSSSGCGDWPAADATAGSVATTNAGNEKDTPAPLRSSHYVCVPTSSQFACVRCRSSIDTHWVPVHASHLCPNTLCVWRRCGGIHRHQTEAVSSEAHKAQGASGVHLTMRVPRRKGVHTGILCVAVCSVATRARAFPGAYLASCIIILFFILGIYPSPHTHNHKTRENGGERREMCISCRLHQK